MSEKVEALFVVLEQTSSEELDRSAQAIAAREKHDAAQFVAHIAEIAARNYHFALGYANLFQYCVERFNLSEGSVYRRTQVARVCRRFPQILTAISKGRLHLTGASMIAPHLTESNVERLIAMAEKATRRELKKRLVEVAPKKAFVPSLRPQAARGGAVSVPSLSAAQSGASVLCDTHSEAAAREMSAAQAGMSEAAPPAMTAPFLPDKGPTRDLVEPATVDRYNFRFSAGSEFTAKFMRWAEVLGIAHPRNHIEDVLSRALEIALEKKDPQRKMERRRQRQARKEAPRPGEGEQCDGVCPQGELSGCSGQVLEAQPAMCAPPGGATCCGVPLHNAAFRDVAVSEVTAGEVTAGDGTASESTAGDASAWNGPARSAPSRHVPAEVRDRVLERAGYQCEYRGSEGRRCTCRTELEVEHTLPFAVYHTHAEESLKVFCAAHNRYAAREFYGSTFIEQKIEAARRAKAERVEQGVAV